MILRTFFFTRLYLDCLGSRFHEIRLRVPAIVVLLLEFLFSIIAFQSQVHRLMNRGNWQDISLLIILCQNTCSKGTNEKYM